MSTTVRILGWEAQGLRCPDHALDFRTGSGDEVWPVSLVQMPNGTGKTTTLELLRAALSGWAGEEEWEPEHVLSLQKKGSSDEKGQFSVDVSIDGRTVSFVLDFDFEHGVVEFYTTLPSGMKRGFHPPRQFAPFTRRDFVQFFVFDGELAEQLTNREHADAERAIDDLFQLDIFVALENRVEEYWKAKVEDRTAKEEKGLSRRRNRVERLEKRIKKLVAERDRLQGEYEKTSALLEQKESRFSDELEEQREQQRRLLQAQKELGEAQNDVQAATERIVELLKNPCSFGEVINHRLHNFKDSLDRVKLPEPAAREFFVELAAQELCVCGRPLDDSTRAEIKERADNYLGSENQGLLNAMKTQIADQYEPDPGRQVTKLDEQVEELREAIARVSRLRTRRDSIEAEAATGDPRLEEAREELKGLREEKERLKHKLIEFEDTTDSGRDQDLQGIAVLRKRLTEAKNKLAEITDTLTLKQKRDVVVDIIKRSHERARVELGRGICDETNQRINTLMPDNNIQVEKIDRCLVLEGQSRGSTGENLTVAYAFLSTLFSRAEHRLPFVVDSPANPIDLEIRREIGALVPKLADQFVAFTISSERVGFLEPLEGAADDIQYLTLFGKTNPKVNRSLLDGQDVDESQDGLVVRGRDFFCSFQVDEEA